MEICSGACRKPSCPLSPHGGAAAPAPGVIRSCRRLHFTGHFGSLPVCSSSGYKRQCYLQYTHPAWRWRCVPSSCIITTCASSQEWDLTPWPPEGDRRHCFGSQSVSRPDGGGGVQSLYAPGCKTFHADVCSYIHGRHRGDHPAFPIQNGNGVGAGDRWL